MAWEDGGLCAGGLMLTSLLAGTATLPFGAYHFGRVQFYFALSNLIAVPLTGVLVMPAGMLALGLMPHWPRVAGAGGDGLGNRGGAVDRTGGRGAARRDDHGAAHAVLGPADGGVRHDVACALAQPGAAGRRRHDRHRPASPALVRPPDLLVSAEARLIGVRTSAGVYLQQVSGASKFTRDAWMNYWAADTSRPFPIAGSAADGMIEC